MHWLKRPLVLTGDKPFWQSVLTCTHMNIYGPSHFFGWHSQGWFSAASLKTGAINGSAVIRYDSTRLTWSKWINSHSLVWKMYCPHPWNQSKLDSRHGTTERWHDSLSFWCLKRVTFSAKHTQHNPIRSHCYTHKDKSFSRKCIKGDGYANVRRLSKQQ